MNQTSNIYEIRIEGLVDGLWAEWFDGMAISYENDQVTVLMGKIPDQAALHGVLGRVCDLGLTLISVRRVEGIHQDYPAWGE
jgi:hypothetical protein